MSCCPDHGDAVLELARGVLGDQEGLRAEELRSSCPRCAEWWKATFSDPAAASVDQAVGEVFAEFAAPVRSRRWLAAAAAAVLAVGVGGTALLWDRGGAVPTPSSSQPAVALDFESGDLSGLVVVQHQTPDGDLPPATAAVFESDLEDGDLSGWTTSS